MIVNPYNNSNNSHINSPSIIPTYNSHDSQTNTPNLSFATHNVNSLQCIIKNTSINDTFIDFNTDFIGLTETCHKSDQFYRYSHDPNFCAFWSSRINIHAGVRILVKRS